MNINIFTMTLTEPIATGGKRKRSHNDTSLPEAANIVHLPSAAFTHIASYLKSPPISRALLAVAIATTAHPDAESLSQDSIVSDIVGDQWDTLDFGAVEKELAAKLSDADISGVLYCIDAVNRLKKLKLTNCISITGSCLEPIRNSRVIKEIDLSLVGVHESPVLDPEPPLSCNVVLPILDSILEPPLSPDATLPNHFARNPLQLRRSLKFIYFPKVWRQQRADNFCEFLQRYSDLWREGQSHHCKKCFRYIEGWGARWVPSTAGDTCGVLAKTCHGCLNHYCDQCWDECGNYLFLNFCCSCERYYCNECSKMRYCERCDKLYCLDCASFSGCGGPGCRGKRFCRDCQLRCEMCDRTSCEDCRLVWINEYLRAMIYECVTCERVCCTHCELPSCCHMCEISFCNDCNDEEGGNGVKTCDDCEKKLCLGCRQRDFKHDGSKCTECYGIIAAAFAEATELHQKVKSCS